MNVTPVCDVYAAQGGASGPHFFDSLGGKEGYCENADNTTWLVSTATTTSYSNPNPKFVVNK